MAVFLADVIRIVAKIIEAPTEKQSLVSAETEIFQNKIRITDGEISRIDGRARFCIERFSGDDEAIDRKHDAAQLGLEQVIGVTSENDGVCRYGTVCGNDS